MKINNTCKYCLVAAICGLFFGNAFSIDLWLGFVGEDEHTSAVQCVSHTAFRYDDDSDEVYNPVIFYPNYVNNDPPNFNRPRVMTLHYKWNATKTIIIPVDKSVYSMDQGFCFTEVPSPNSVSIPGYNKNLCSGIKHTANKIPFYNTTDLKIMFTDKDSQGAVYTVEEMGSTDDSGATDMMCLPVSHYTFQDVYEGQR